MWGSVTCTAYGAHGTKDEQCWCEVGMQMKWRLREGGIIQKYYFLKLIFSAFSGMFHSAFFRLLLKRKEWSGRWSKWSEYDGWVQCVAESWAKQSQAGCPIDWLGNLASLDKALGWAFLLSPCSVRQEKRTCEGGIMQKRQDKPLVYGLVSMFGKGGEDVWKDISLYILLLHLDWVLGSIYNPARSTLHHKVTQVSLRKLRIPIWIWETLVANSRCQEGTKGERWTPIPTPYTLHRLSSYLNTRFLLLKSFVFHFKSTHIGGDDITEAGANAMQDM